MRDKLPVSRFTTSVCVSLLVLLNTAVAHAQRGPRIAPPPTLLQILDKEDRDCVLTNGSLSKSVHTQSIRLAMDGAHTLLVRGSSSCLCGAQNCGFWVYRQKNRNYELLLKGAGSIKVNAGRNSSKGYRDVVSESHASAIETIVRTYRFNGIEYRLARCVSRAYYDDSGKPTTAPISRPCNE